MTPKEQIKATAAELGVTMTTAFVPWSQSRNAGEKAPCLNWKVTLHRMTKHMGGYDGLPVVPMESREILTTDYSADCRHCPSYTRPSNVILDIERRVKLECEDGISRKEDSKPIVPELADVLHSLVSDAEVLDHSTFESWAGDLGYDTDSRKADGIYRARLDIALKLRNALGEDGLRKLREACQDY